MAHSTEGFLQVDPCLDGTRDCHSLHLDRPLPEALFKVSIVSCWARPAHPLLLSGGARDLLPGQERTLSSLCIIHDPCSGMGPGKTPRRRHPMESCDPHSSSMGHWPPISTHWNTGHETLSEQKTEHLFIRKDDSKARLTMLNQCMSFRI